MMTTGRSRLCCLIGDPVSHSLSPHMFSAAFSKIGADYAYLAFRVKPKDLEIALKGLRAIEFAGCNITMPHKIEVVKHLNKLDGAARLIGSVNVVANTDVGLVGYNTDGVGALTSLELEGVEMNKKRVLIVGYGGAARALAFETALRKKPSQILIAGRDRAKADALAIELERMVRAEGIDLNNKDLESEGVDIIINATPVGMRPDIDESPIPESLLQPGIAVLDLVYDPGETKLLRLAKKRGCRAIDGVETLVQQGAIAFSIWTGLPAPVEDMRKAVREMVV